MKLRSDYPGADQATVALIRGSFAATEIFPHESGDGVLIVGTAWDGTSQVVSVIDTETFHLDEDGAWSPGWAA